MSDVTERPDPPDPTPVEVTLRDNVGEGAGRYARLKVAEAMRVAHARVLRATVVLDWRHNPASDQHALAEASLHVDAHQVRAKVSAPTMQEAVDRLEYRLRRQLVQLQERTRSRQRWTHRTGEHEWRHGAEPTPRLPWFPRSVAERDVVRRKSVAGPPMDVDEAAYDMDLLGHDFYLYRDAGTGGPALVHRLPDGGYGVQRGGTNGNAPPTGAATTSSGMVHGPTPPVLTDDAARRRLEDGGEPYVFYAEASTGDGRVLYHRYDGHLGLISLAG